MAVPESEAIARARKAKEDGNEHFREKEYSKAVKCYTEAIKTCPGGHQELAVFHKNRAACWLKLEDYDKALADATASLEITPGDMKSLYRKAQALEGKGNLADAFKDIKRLLTLYPNNKEAIEAARRLTAALKQQADTVQSTDNIVNEMFSALENKKLSQERQIQAAKNFAILSRESAGAERIFQAGGVSRLLPLLDSEIQEVAHHTLQTFVGLCSEHKSRAYAVIQGLSLEKLSALISSPYKDISTSAVTVLKQAILAVTGVDKRTPREADSAVVVSENALIAPVLQMLFISLLSHDVSTDARDYIMELLITTIPQGNLGELYMKEGLITKLLRLASSTSEISNAEVKISISEDCRMNISVVLSKLYESFGRKKDLKETFTKECGAFVLTNLSNGDTPSLIKGLTALATILQGVLEVGNTIFSEESVLSRMVEMADSEDLDCQIIAAEALALAASDKDRCHGIMAKGLPVLKELCAASDDRIRVRALVGLCKLGSVGGGNVNAQTFEQGSTVKLEKSCRKFLVSAKKGASVKKWAAEGLAFLTLDAEVKEALISDKPALNVLLNMPKTGDQSLLYGIATIFVNLTNSYEKAERNPELEELGRYAGENVPKEHEFDGEEYVKKRVATLLEAGVVPTLLVLSSNDSKAIHEQISRVFLALTEDPSLRGTIIQQGGAKCLVPLAIDNTDKGKFIAAQALAKIGITNNPKLAFPGQRSLEVIRPLVQLLKSEHGLQQFEGLMALTNLAGVNDDIRRRIWKEGGVPLMESLMFEEHELIRRAATEALSNMIPLQEVHERFYHDDIERVKLWTLFSGEDDPALALAASGGVAQLSHDPKICDKIMQVKSTMEILKELTVSENKELQYRGLYILANLVEASKEIAHKIIESEFLELFMALVQGECEPRVKAIATRALQKAMEYGLIQPNPELK